APFGRCLHPRYLNLSLLLGLLTGILFVVLQMFTGETGLSLYALLALLSALFMGVNRAAINPIKRSREGTEEKSGSEESTNKNNTTFNWLHRLTVGLNYVCIVLNGWVLFGISRAL
ncbi:MAG: hypothetical protein ABEK50_01655, partial [bacterium]